MESTMKSKGFRLLMSLAGFYAMNALGGGEIQEVVTSQIKEIYPFYLKLGTGASFSSKADISVDTRVWDPSPNGYNATLKNSELYELGVGYSFSPLWSLEITGTTRPSYRYRKFQQSQTANTPGFLGDKTRFFKLTSHDILLNLLLDTGICDRLAYSFGESKLRPILGAGLGAAYNTVRDFHSKTAQAVSQNPPLFSVATIMNNHTKTSFAYQLFTGLRLTCRERFNIDLGYRYFNGGRFLSNSYIVDVATNLPTPITVPAWRGKLKAQEVFLSLSYALL